MARDVSTKAICDDGFSITPHDTNELTSAPAFVYVGTTGDVKVKSLGGTDLTFANVPAGVTLPIKVVMVYSTGTTASDLVAIY